MSMGQGWITKRMLSAFALSLLLVVTGVLAGCGKKEPVQTDVTQPTDYVPTEPVPEPPTPEVPDEGTGAPAVDYAALDPSEYGIEDVFFDFDVYALSDAAMNTLSDDARIMRDHRDIVWLVEGHCDERGTVEYNLALGEKRAIATRDYLISLGVPSHQLRITTYGEERPFVFGSNENAWAQNRRGHFARP